MSERRQVRKQTGELLMALGTTPDEVAAALVTAGALGVPGSNHGCAVARYVSATMGADPRIRSVLVGRCAVVVDLTSSPSRQLAGRLAVPLPPAVRRFVEEFDRGARPELDGTSGVRAGPVDVPAPVAGPVPPR
jgi:hypothetical protein